MGNTQTGEVKPGKAGKTPGKVKGIMKIRGKKKQGEPSFTEIVPQELNEEVIIAKLPVAKSSEISEHFSEGTKNSKQSDDAGARDTLQVDQRKATDSWYSADETNEGIISKIATPSSVVSSESNFMDAPQSPQDYSDNFTNTRNIDTPDNFLHNLTLNSFKLNEYRMKHEEEKSKKLNKLGVSKTSQISLESDPRECFETGEVQVVRKMENDFCENEQVTEDKNVIHLIKRMSEANINNAGPPDYKRHMSVPEDVTDISRCPESGVLKKVTSLTLSRADLESKISKPKFVPEKLDFQLYEKFEGHMLINWYVSELDENHPLGKYLSEQELKLLAVQFCTHLLAAGVLKQLRDKDVPMYNVFKPDCIYYWTYAEIPQSVPQTPGRISMVSWPPNSPSSCDVITKSLGNEMVMSSAPRTPDEHLEKYDNSENEQSPPATRRTEFSSSARDVEILSLEEEIKRLRQEVEKYKTLIEIQTLTANAVKDFGSPIDETKTIQQICDNRGSDNNLDSFKEVEALDGHVHRGERVSRESQTYSSTIMSKTDVECQTESQETSSISVANDTSTKQDKISVVSEVAAIGLSKNESTLPLQKPRTLVLNSITPTQAQDQSQGPPTMLPPSGGHQEYSLQNVNVPPPPPMPNQASPSSNIAVPPPPPLPSLHFQDPYSLSTSSPVPLPPPMPGNTCPQPPPLPPFIPGNTCPIPPPPPMMPGSVFSIPPPPPLMPGSVGPVPPPPPLMMMGIVGPPPPPLPNSIGGPPPPPPPPGVKLGNSKGPTPLPTPPPGGWNAQKAALRKNPLNPKAPMKPLYWTRILAPQTAEQPDGSKTALWNEIDELSTDSLDEFSELFSRQVVTRKPSAVKKVEQKAKIEAVKLLDSKRSQNVGILAQSLHIDFQEIENAIYNFDTSIVSLEALQQIYEARATPDEMESIKNHLATKPEVPLDKPETFLHELSEISNFAERISCLMFMVEFEDSINTISHTLTNIKTTCEYLVSSKELKKILAIILTLGNYMNGGNVTRGQADGFGLEILGKLKDVKSKDSKITLLHYVVRMYLKSVENPFDLNLTLPIPQPEDIRRAASVNFDDVKIDLQKLQKQLEGCENKSRKVIENSHPENLQPFKDKMTTFIEHSKKQLTQEHENLEECRSKFVLTMKFYLFIPKTGTLETFPPNSFFELWLSFCVDFKDIFKKELIRMEKEKMQEIKKKESENKSTIVKTKERRNGLKAKVMRYQEKLT